MILSDYLENAMLDHLLRGGTAPYTKPATLYFALFTADPGESGVTGEVSGGSYARKAVTNDNASFPQCTATGAPTKSNGIPIVFVTATASWGTVTHWAIYDHGTNSTNMLAHGALATTRTVASGDSPKFSTGALAITATNITAGGLTTYAQRKLLDHVFGGPAYNTAALTVYTGLGTALSGETLTEWTDSSYARQETVFDAASGGMCDNDAEETYSSDVVDDATLTHFGAWDDVTSGNLLAVGSLAVSKAVTANDTVKLPQDTLTITVQ